MIDTSKPPQASAGRVTAGEIADLLAWARSLSTQRLDTDPAELAAFLKAKTELLARITDNNADTTHAPGGQT